MRNTEDEDGESLDGRSAAGFGEPPPRRKGWAGATSKQKIVKTPMKPKWGGCHDFGVESEVKVSFRGRIECT